MVLRGICQADVESQCNAYGFGMGFLLRPFRNAWAVIATISGYLLGSEYQFTLTLGKFLEAMGSYGHRTLLQLICMRHETMTSEAPLSRPC
jgi:hypothetical protein